MGWWNIQINEVVSIYCNFFTDSDIINCEHSRNACLFSVIHASSFKQLMFRWLLNQWCWNYYFLWDATIPSSISWSFTPTENNASVRLTLLIIPAPLWLWKYYKRVCKIIWWKRLFIEALLKKSTPCVPLPLKLIFVITISLFLLSFLTSFPYSMLPIWVN